MVANLDTFLRDERLRETQRLTGESKIACWGDKIRQPNSAYNRFVDTMRDIYEQNKAIIERLKRQGQKQG